MVVHKTKSIILQLYLFVQKATITGPLSTRTEVVVSFMEDDKTITVKFCNDKMALCHHINLGQEVRAYAVVSTFFRNKVALTTTDETVIQVS